ncbi:MAG: hypothetical protein WCP69_05050 [Bacteroidota bacterium]|jgi:hypothetical protein
MKKHNFLAIGIIAISILLGSCTNNNSDKKVEQKDSVKTEAVKATVAFDYSGTYSITDKSVCDLTIEIQKKDTNFTYTSGKTKGNIEIIKQENEVYLNLLAINGKSPKGDVEAKYENETLLIQNEGNSMNKYTNFSKCDAKYLELKRVKK